MHQSGRNSGVIHAGYNLKPVRPKPILRRGQPPTRDYCEDRVSRFVKAVSCDTRPRTDSEMAL